MRRVVTVLLFAAGLIHLAPLAGVAGTERLAALYGVEVTEPNLLILLRHRAVLFGVLGGLLLAAAFKEALQPVAIAAGAVATVSFIALATLAGGYNAQIQAIVWVDVAAAAALAVAAILRTRLGAVVEQQGGR